MQSSKAKLNKKVRAILLAILLLASSLLFACKNRGDHAAYLVENHGAVIIDVRAASEFQARHIYGAINIPLNMLQSMIDDKVDSREAHLIVYCRSGTRSRDARQILIGLGFINVYDLGTINNWRGNFNAIVIGTITNTADRELRPLLRSGPRRLLYFIQ